ncbi:hypothetical protein SteCoe_29696 [Stentor coeruleus]|uniref:Major facilitator superfamily (MFS) profile domain-containing protein n=1 Tax=Stentor coeruleus TaxID=5963 RepID=A0A1R2B5C0_9CILI|nr:hypothetical protein SteCoe_29696 [Stentor coeruleus]
MPLYTETSNSLRVISSSPSNIFEIYTLNIILSFDYYIITLLLPLYYSTSFGLSDLHAGYIFGCTGLFLSILSFTIGHIVPEIGCKRGLVLSTLSVFSGFMILSMCRSFYISLFAILGLICFGIALSGPLIGIGVKRYSDSTNRSTSVSILMMGTYLAGIIAGTYVDIVWNFFEDKAVIFDIIFSTAAGASGLGFFIAVTLKSNEKLEGNQLTSPNSVIFTKKFWKFLIVIGFVTLLHSVCFEQLDATFPKFITRVIGDKAHFGIFFGIYSANMLIGALAFTPLTFKLSSYTLIMLGGSLGALASFMLFLGSTNLNFIAFALLLSSGECILVPRTLDYTMKVASEGEEGVYLAVCNSPYYFGMILTGIISGKLLENYCPEYGDKSCFFIWKVVSVCAICVVMLMGIFKYCISHNESQAETGDSREIRN